MKRPSPSITHILSLTEENTSADLAALEYESIVFKRFEAKKADPVDFFDPHTLRFHYFNIPYQTRPELDENLKKALEEQNNIILVGRRGMGKSRLLLENIREARLDGIIYLLQNSFKVHNLDAKNPEFVHPLDISSVVKNAKQKTHYLIIENIGDYEGFDELFSCIQEWAKNPKICLVITGSMEEFKKFPFLLELISNAPSLRFSLIQIPDIHPKFTEDITCAIQQFTGEEVILDRYSDKTIGSIVKNSKKFTEAYLELDYDSYSKRVLWALKCLHYLTLRYEFLMEDVVAFTISSLRQKQNFSNSLQEETTRIQETILSLDKDSLLFFNDKKRVVYIPQNYLTKVAKGYLFDILTSKNILYETKRNEEEIYVIEDILSLPVFNHPRLMKIVGNTILQHSKSKFTRETLFDTVSETLNMAKAIDGYTFNTLIRNAQDLEEAEKWEKRRQTQQLKPDLDTLAAFSCFLPSYPELKAKEQALNLDFDAHSFLLCLHYLWRASTLGEIEEILQRFSPKTLRTIPAYFFQVPLKRLSSFNEGYRVCQMIRSLGISPEPDFYKTLILLKGGLFELAFEVFELLQNEDITLTDNAVLLALANKAAYEDDIEKVTAELERLPEDQISNEIYAVLVEKHKKAGLEKSSNKLISKLKLLNNEIKNYHHILAYDDNTPEERRQILEKLLSLGEPQTHSFELYLDHPSVSFQEAHRWYEKMKELHVYPSFRFFEIILNKFSKSNPQEKFLPDEIVMLYEDIKDMMEHESGKGFEPLFLALYRTFKNFDDKIDLFHLGISLKLDVEQKIKLLYCEGKSYVDALKILEVIYAARIIPEVDVCFRLQKKFIPNSPKEEDLCDLILFFKDLKNCSVNDESLSRLYIKIINIEGSSLKRHHFLESIKKEVGIQFSPEVLVEALFMELKQGYLFKETLNDFFPEDEINEKIIELLVLNCSNFKSAYEIYKFIATEGKTISLQTYKKLLEYAIVGTAEESIWKVLSEVLSHNTDYIVPLLTKLEQSKRHQHILEKFLTTTDINLDSFQNRNNRMIWQNKVEAAFKRIRQEQFSEKSLLNIFNNFSNVEAALFACQNIIQKNPELQITFIKKLLKKSPPNQISKIYEFCVKQNVNFYDPEITGSFILHSKNEETNKKIFLGLQKHYKKVFTDQVEYYKNIIYPFYCLISVATRFDYPTEMLGEITRAYANVNPVVLGKLALLIQTPQEVDEFLQIAQTYKVPVLEVMMDRLVECQSVDKVWALFEKYKNEIKKYGSNVYEDLLKMQVNKKGKDLADFKHLLSSEAGSDKFTVIFKCMLASGIMADEATLSLCAGEKVGFGQFSKTLSIYEKEGHDFPVKLLESKVESMTKLSQGERLRKYGSLISVLRSAKTLEFIVEKLMKNRGVDSSLLLNVISRENNLVHNMKTLKILSNFHLSFPDKFWDQALLSVVGGINDLQQFEYFEKQLKTLAKGKLKESSAVNAVMFEKKFRLNFN